MTDFNQRIFVGVTCTSAVRKNDHWKEQLKEIKKFKIKEIALFPTNLAFSERQEMYQQLALSGVKEVKLLHIRDDFNKKEIEHFYQKYHTRWFNCHHDNFDLLYRKFPQYRKNILLEMHYSNQIKNKIEPSQAGGFCLDLSHFKEAEVKRTAEYGYVLKHLKDTPVRANHLNGYSKITGKEFHFVNSIKQFDYLKGLPKKVFSKVIGLELENSITTQLKFKKYLVKLLNKKFS